MKIVKTSPYIPTDITVKEVGKNRINIVAYPFETGYAVTLAHPIRRLLLSSTVGYSVIGLKFEGVSHEFDSVVGLLEDISPFIVNLKNIRFLINDKESDSIEVDYEFKGPKILTGADLIKDELNVVNPESYLATINEDADIKFTIIVQKGIGFVPSEDIRESMTESFIPLDAYFTPVKRAVYHIDNILVEDNPNFEKITFDIETDGQISPKDAFNEAISIMHKQMAIFGGNTNFIHSEVSTESSGSLKALLVKIDTLKSELSQRCINCLQRADIVYIGELALMDEADIKNIKNLGKKVYDEIADKLNAIGYPIGSELPSDVANSLQRQITKLKN